MSCWTLSLTCYQRETQGKGTREKCTHQSERCMVIKACSWMVEFDWSRRKQRDFWPREVQLKHKISPFTFMISFEPWLKPSRIYNKNNFRSVFFFKRSKIFILRFIFPFSAWKMQNPALTRPLIHTHMHTYSVLPALQYKWDAIDTIEMKCTDRIYQLWRSLSLTDTSATVM